MSAISDPPLKYQRLDTYDHSELKTKFEKGEHDLVKTINSKLYEIVGKKLQGLGTDYKRILKYNACRIEEMLQSHNITFSSDDSEKVVEKKIGIINTLQQQLDKECEVLSKIKRFLLKNQAEVEKLQALSRKFHSEYRVKDDLLPEK